MAPSRPMFTRLNHIGVIVENVGEARRWMTEVFGLRPSRSVDVPEGRIHGEFFDTGNAEIEFIEIGDPEQRRKRLGEGRRARIEHIAVEVEDLKAALTHLATLGVRITTPEPRRVGDTLSAWTAEETTGGVSYQLIQRNVKP